MEINQLLIYYLILGPLTKDEEFKMVNMPLQNVNQHRKKVGKMKKSTHDMLRKFYYPYTKQLYELLGDKRFLWNDIYNSQK